MQKTHTKGYTEHFLAGQKQDRMQIFEDSLRNVHSVLSD